MDEATFTDPSWWFDHRAEAFEALFEASRDRYALKENPAAERLCLSVEEASELLRVSRSALYEAIARDEVPSVRIPLTRRGSVIRVAVCAELQDEREGGWSSWPRV